MKFNFFKHDDPRLVWGSPECNYHLQLLSKFLYESIYPDIKHEFASLNEFTISEICNGMYFGGEDMSKLVVSSIESIKNGLCGIQYEIMFRNKKIAKHFRDWATIVGRKGCVLYDKYLVDFKYIGCPSVVLNVKYPNLTKQYLNIYWTPDLTKLFISKQCFEAIKKEFIYGN